MQFCNYCSYSSISLKSYLLPWTFFLSLEIPGSPKAYKARSGPGTVEDSIFLTPRDTCLGVVFLLPHTDPSWTCSHEVLWILGLVQGLIQGLTQQDTGTV